MKEKVLKKGIVMFLVMAIIGTSLLGCNGAAGSSESTKETGSSSEASSSPEASGETTAAAIDSIDAAAGEGKVLNIYCWNEQFQERFEKLYADKVPEGVEVKWLITPTQNNAYQEKLDQDLPVNEAASEPIDIFLLEADYILKYVNSDVSVDIKELGITDDDLKEQYKYTQEIATDQDGKLKATSWEADPGVFVYRRSIAKDVLGTDDPDEVQAYISDWNKFSEVAAQMQGKGYQMLSGFDDAYRTFSNNVSQPWVNENDEIVIDPAVEQWVDQTKEFTDSGYNNKTSLWSPEWNSDQGPTGKVFGFFYSTWGVNFTLLGNALETPEAEGGKKEIGNGVYGDYAICYGPANYYWGGTWIAAARGTDNPTLVADVMRTITCDAESMKELTYGFEDFVNNQAAMQEVADSDYTSDFLGGQNHIALFLEVAPKIDMSNVSEYDQGLTESFQAAMMDYFNGQVTKEEAVDNFYTAAIEKYPNLKRP